MAKTLQDELAGVLLEMVEEWHDRIDWQMDWDCHVELRDRAFQALHDAGRTIPDRLKPYGGWPWEREDGEEAAE
jgi:hypothetical protein